MITLFQALRAAILDGRVHQEASEDAESMLRAFSIVLASAVAFGLGVRAVTPVDQLEVEGWPEWMLLFGIENVAMLLAIATMFTSWMLWSAVAYYVGTFLLRGQAGFRRVLRALGFAYSPGVLLVFMGIFPGMQGGIFNITGLWLLASGSVAIKEAQAFGWFKTMLPVLFGWFIAWPFLTFLILSPLTTPS